MCRPGRDQLVLPLADFPGWKEVRSCWSALLFRGVRREGLLEAGPLALQAALWLFAPDCFGFQEVAPRLAGMQSKFVGWRWPGCLTRYLTVSRIWRCYPAEGTRLVVIRRVMRW